MLWSEISREPDNKKSLALFPFVMILYNTVRGIQKVLKLFKINWTVYNYLYVVVDGESIAINPHFNS